MAIGISSFQTLYQTYYPDAQLPYLTPKDAVLLNLFLGGSTDTQVSGDQVDMPWLLSPSAGVSQSYSTAAAAANNAPVALRPIVRMSQIYKNLSFLDKDDILSRGEASYGELMETTVAGVRFDVMNKIDQLLHGNGTGNRCAVTYTTANAAKLPLVTAPTQLTGDTGAKLSGFVAQTSFEVNDQVVLTSNNPNDGSAVTIVAGPLAIVSVDGAKNTITLSADPGLSNGNVYGVSLAGDTLGFSTALLLPGLIGVAAYNPFGGPVSGENFLGVDRTKFSTRAAGTYFDATSGYSFEQGLRKEATQMKNTGVEAGGVTVCMYPDDYDTLDFKLTSQNRYTTHEVGAVFFDALAVNSTMGQLRVVVDTKQGQGYARFYAPNAVELMYRNSLPHFATLKNGQDELFGSNYDGREMRLRAYVQTRCRDPRKLGVAALPQSI